MTSLLPSTVYIALGSNLGDRLTNLQTAMHQLTAEVCIMSASPIYETPPWGYIDQPAFLNQVLYGTTELKPTALLQYLKAIEQRMGREKVILNGPRLVDLDLLLYADLVLDTPHLAIPHPRMRGRGFVLQPLADLAPNLHHPVFDLTIADLLGECDLTGITCYAPAPFIHNCAPTGIPDETK